MLLERESFSPMSEWGYNDFTLTKGPIGKMASDDGVVFLEGISKNY